MIIGERRGLRWAVSIWVAAVGGVALILGIRLGRFTRTWTLAEWLINYQGGFVRRGLPGECIFLVHQWTHLPLPALAVATWLALEMLLLIAWRGLVLQASSRIWVFALLISPATLVFSLLDYTVGFRKEVIVLAAISMLLVLLRSAKLSDTAAGIFVGVALLIATFSHEPAIIFAPYFFAALVVCGRSPKRAAYICAIPFLLAIVAAGASVIHRGDPQTVSKICASLGDKQANTPGGICEGGGAIPFLEFSTRSAFDKTMETIREYHYLTGYGILAVLALAPILLGTWELRHTQIRRQLLVCWTMAGISCVGSLALFLVGIDWGRWIRIHVMCLASLFFVLSALADPQREAASSRSFSPIKRFAVSVLLLLYATGWVLPGVYGWSTHFGYRHLAREIRTAFFRHVPAIKTAAVHSGVHAGAASDWHPQLAATLAREFNHTPIGT